MMICSYDDVYAQLDYSDIVEDDEIERPLCKGVKFNEITVYRRVVTGEKRITPRRAAPKSQGQPGNGGSGLGRSQRPPYIMMERIYE